MMNINVTSEWQSDVNFKHLAGYVSFSGDYVAGGELFSIPSKGILKALIFTGAISFGTSHPYVVSPTIDNKVKVLDLSDGGEIAAAAYPDAVASGGSAHYPVGIFPFYAIYQQS